MIKNYIKVAVRNIFNKKLYSFLNLLGLSIGIASAVLIIFYVQDELSFDKFHPDVEDKYVVGINGKIGSQEVSGIFTPPVLAPTIVEEVPEVTSATRTFATPEIVIRHQENAFTEDNVFYADSNFYDFFGYELLRGDPNTVLEGPNKAVITESVAKKYFGNQDPVGKTLLVGNDKNSYEVTGVNADPPTNSHFQFNILLSFSSIEYSRSNVWVGNSINTYVELHPDATSQDLQEGFDFLIKKYVGPQMEEFMGITLAQLEEQGGKYGYFSVPILDLHLNAPNVQTTFEPPGNIMYIYIFSAIGIFLIVIASVNFMNLSTASASGRAKEVGLRKTLGSYRSGMIVQFLVESILYVFLAALMSVIMIYLVLPWFNQLSGKELTMNIFTQAWFLLSLGGLVLLVGLLAGSYPAFYLTSFNPVDVLKGKIRREMKGGGFRRVLVTGQFFISIGLIICTVLVYQQLQFMQNKNLGFDKENTIILTNTNRLGNNLDVFKEELMSDSRIISASYSNFTLPGTQNVTAVKKPESRQEYLMMVYAADYNHADALGLEMKKGRFFSRDFATDTAAVVINETAVREMGFDDPLGREVIIRDDTSQKYKIVGVVKNFNFQSLRNEIMPLGIVLTETANEMTVRYKAQDPREAVNLIQNTWDSYAGSEPINYEFLDNDFDKLFRQEMRLGNVFTVFTVIAIFIACLGLLGLSAYMAERRRQEIGIRKVMGASVSSILKLLSTEFMKLVGIAFVIAAPVAWFLMSDWLQNFAYRIEISPFIFLITAAVTAFVVLLTISWQTLRAALMNPVESIRTE